jgi:hypothetical protein
MLAFLSEEIRRHAGNVLKQSLYLYFFRKKSSASKISCEKMLNKVCFEEIMKPAGFFPNRKRLSISLEKLRIYSEEKMRHAGFIPNNLRLIISSEEIMLIFRIL